MPGYLTRMWQHYSCRSIGLLGCVLRIAVFSDVHGNLPALKAALHQIQEDKVDSIYHLGDMIGIGPFPAECLDLWSKTPRTVSLMGNHDAFLVYGLPDPLPSSITPEEADHHRWIFSTVNPSLRLMVSAWPFSLVKQLGGLVVVFLHYALDETGRRYLSFLKNPEPSDLDSLFGRMDLGLDAGMDVDLVLYGHDHRESDMVGKARYLSPGSLGCYSEAVARYLILEIDNDSECRITKHMVPYDDTSIFAELERRKVPARETICRSFFPRTD